MAAHNNLWRENTETTPELPNSKSNCGCWHRRKPQEGRRIARINIAATRKPKGATISLSKNRHQAIDIENTVLAYERHQAASHANFGVESLRRPTSASTGHEYSPANSAPGPQPLQMKSTKQKCPSSCDNGHFLNQQASKYLHNLFDSFFLAAQN